jgi:hypothetical protein
MTFIQPFTFLDPPLVLDCSVTPIPAASSGTLQVIANTGPNTLYGFAFSDSTGEHIGVYVGPVGSEKLSCIIGNGVTSISYGLFPAGARVSIRNLINLQITSGKLSGALIAK